MSGTINKVILIGNLGRDPETHMTKDGRKVANLNLATSETWKDRTSGERKEKTEWHRVVIFNDHLVDIAEKYLSKGRKVYVEGQLQTRKWTDQSGVEKYTTEIVVNNFGGVLEIMDFKGGDDAEKPAESTTPKGAATSSKSKASPPDTDYGDLDDDIPF